MTPRTPSRRRHPIPALAIFALGLGAGPFFPAPTAAAAPSPEIFRLAVPPRPAGALAGSEILARLEGSSAAERRRRFLAELLAGNVPQFLRRLRPVEMAPAGRSPGGPVVVIGVTPDYLAVGSDEDFVRVPLGLDEAVAIARRFGATLPTPRMVDRIHDQADLRLAPQPLRPGPAMTSISYLRRHERAIATQLSRSPLGWLVAGDKKDLVLSRRLDERPDRVAIYGWHHRDGRPIQPLSTWHGAGYADYSHGVRLVSASVLLHGEPRSVFDLLEDPALASLLSDEGTIPGARRLLEAEVEVAGAVSAQGAEGWATSLQQRNPRW